jgi:hypothetical protein
LKPRHGAPRPDDRAIDIDREAGELQARERVGHEVAIEGAERRHGLLAKLAEPVGHGAPFGQAGQAAEAGDERIAGEIAQVRQASRADVEQGQDHQDKARTAIVTA